MMLIIVWWFLCIISNATCRLLNRTFFKTPWHKDPMIFLYHLERYVCFPAYVLYALCRTFCLRSPTPWHWTLPRNSSLALGKLRLYSAIGHSLMHLTNSASWIAYLENLNENEYLRLCKRYGVAFGNALRHHLDDGHSLQSRVIANPEFNFVLTWHLADYPNCTILPRHSP